MRALFVSLPQSWHHLFAMFIWHLWSVRWSLPAVEWAACSFQNRVPVSALPQDARQASGLAGGQSALEPEHSRNDTVETRCLIHEKCLWQNMNNWIYSRSNTGNRAWQNSCILSIREIAVAQQPSLFPAGHSRSQTRTIEGKPACHWQQMPLHSRGNSSI